MLRPHRRPTIEIVSVPDKIEFGTEFSELFAGILFEPSLGMIKNHEMGLYDQGENVYSVGHVTHAAILPYAERFLNRTSTKNIDPALVFNTAMKMKSKLLPGGSLETKPFVIYPHQKSRDIFDQMNFAEEDEMAIVDKNNSGKIVYFNRAYYNRIFGAIISAVAHVSEDRGYKTPVVVPDFDRTPMSYLPEGLERGTVVIDGPVINMCGKHSTGGTIIVRGYGSHFFGDTSRGVTYYIKGGIDDISSGSNNKFFIGGELGDKKNLDSLLKFGNTLVEGEEGRAAYDHFVGGLNLKE